MGSRARLSWHPFGNWCIPLKNEEVASCLPAPLSTPQPHPSSTDHISTFRLYQALTQGIQALYRDCTAPPAGNGAGAVLRRPRICRPAGRLRLRVCDGAALQADNKKNCVTAFHASTAAALRPPAAPAGQLPTFAAWQTRCKENGEGTVTLHDIWGVMLQGVPSEPGRLPAGLGFGGDSLLP